MLKEYLQKLLNKHSLTQQEAEEAMTLILEEGDLAQVAAFLSILRYRGETVEEIVGMVRALQKKAISVPLPYATIDIVGTGGDLASTVNISTGAAILAAACGIPIAKHGNRSVSSRSGSADVLEALGIELEMVPAELITSLKNFNIAFMYAPFYHPCLKKVGSLRKGLGFPTVFNLLGPLLNPAKSEFALIGVANQNALELIAKAVLLSGDKKRALVFHGSGLDELTSLGVIHAYHIHDGNIDKIEIDPIALGFPTCSLQSLQGGDAILNAKILEEVFLGADCPIGDALILNAGAALWIYGRSSSLEEGILEARSVLRSRKAFSLLEEWKTFSNQLKLSRQV